MSLSNYKKIAAVLFFKLCPMKLAGESRALSSKVLRSAILGGLVLFIWSAFCWMALPFMERSFLTFKDESAVVQTIIENVPRTGIYVMPNCHAEGACKDMSAVEAKMKSGPLIFASISLEGRDMNMLKPMITSIATSVIAVGIVSWLLFQMQLSFRKRVICSLLVGLAISIYAHSPFWIWFGFPCSFVSFCMFEAVVGWLLAGFVIAKIGK